MSAGEENRSALVPAQTAALTKAGAKSLAARGRADLRVREEAEEWLQKGLEFYYKRLYEDAFACFERGTQLCPNHSATQLMLGVLYYYGQGVPQDRAQAAVWYRMAAEQGLVEAQFSLGFQYNFQDGLPRDYALAAFWYRKAAEQGHARAQRQLGALYAFGQVVPPDDEQAEIWYRKATEQGDADAPLFVDYAWLCGEGENLNQPSPVQAQPMQSKLHSFLSERQYPKLSDAERKASLEAFDQTKDDLQPSTCDETSGGDQPSGSGGTTLT